MRGGGVDWVVKVEGQMLTGGQCRHLSLAQLFAYLVPHCVRKHGAISKTAWYLHHSVVYVICPLIRLGPRVLGKLLLQDNADSAVVL